MLKNLILFLALNSTFFYANAAIDKSRRGAGIKTFVEQMGDMTHLEFRGKKEWDYNLNKKNQFIHMTVPRLSLDDVEKIQSYSGTLIKKVKVDQSVPNKTKLIFELVDEFIESFDYLTQEPSNLVVDFFISEEGLEKRKQKARTARRKSKKKNDFFAKTNGKSRTQKRKPAFAEYLSIRNGKGDGQLGVSSSGEMSLKPVGSFEEVLDFSLNSNASQDSLEAKVIEAKGNIYLRFPLLKLSNRHLKELGRFRPEYEIKESFSDENKQARFLLKLFDQRSYASFIKAKKIYKKRFSVSKYDEILDYIEADIWTALWEKNGDKEYMEKAMTTYRMLIERYPSSKITERTLINAGLLSHHAENYFLATKMLKRYLANYPNSPFKNYAKIYLADSLSHMKNYEKARSLYDDVISEGGKSAAAEAQFRIGDIYFLKQNFRKSERAYQKAIKRNPAQVSKFPNAYFNMAEAQFNLAEYPASLKSYKNFFKNYPTHPYSGFALTRMGELVDILSDDLKKAQGFYNESFFRFRKSTGGVIARIRSLSQRFKDMKSKELKASIEEMKAQRKAIDLPQVDEFISFMISDGFYSSGNFMKAADALIKYFQINPQPANIHKFEKRISRAIAGEVRKQLAKGNIIQAMSIIESHQKSWLSKSRRVDVQYFRGLAYEKLDLFKEAKESYTRLMSRVKLLEGSKEEKERKVFEYYPSYDKLKLRKAVAAYGLGERDEAVQLLKEIKSVKDLSSKMKADYYFTLAKLSYDQKKYPTALKMAKLVEEKDVLNNREKEKFHVFISQVYEKNGKFDKAINILEDHYKKYKKDQDQVYVLSRLFHLYKGKGMSEKAISVGQRLLTEYDAQYDLDKERYYLGELYYVSKKQKEAQKIWKGIAKKTMWERLAKNRVENDSWKQKTEESVKRIPAMAK